MELFLRVGLGNAMMATLLALGAACAGCLLRQRPAVRHALWLLVLVKLITPPLWVFPLVRIGTDASSPQVETVVLVDRIADEAGFEAELLPAAIEPEPPVTRSWSSRLPHVELGPIAQSRLGWLWLGVSLASLSVTGLRIRRWNRLLRFVAPVSEDVQEGVDLLAHAMGIAHPPRAYWFPGASAPLLWAVGCRPCLIVPRKLWDRLDDRQRTTLLVHELAHLKRKDHWVRLVELFATAFYWWLPTAWIARWALREAEEQCCDAWVVWTCPDANRAYAETLLDTVDFLSETGRTVPLAASGFGHAHHLKRRLTMIMKGTTPRGLSWNGMLGLFGLAGLLLPLSPTWAQDEDEAKADRDVVVEVKVDADDSDLAELDAVKKKLAAEIQRIQSLEKQAAEKARAAADKVRAAADKVREAAEKRRAESADALKIKVKEKAKDKDKDEETGTHDPNRKDQTPGEKADNAKEKDKDDDQDKRKDEVRVIEEKAERAPRPRLFRYENRIQREGRPAEVQIHRIDESVAKELAHAKLEVARARAQLDQAERQLARLNADLKAKTSESTRSPNVDGKPELQKRGPSTIYVRPEIQLHDIDAKLKDFDAKLKDFDVKFDDFDPKIKEKREPREGRAKADDQADQSKDGDERRREAKRLIEAKVKGAIEVERRRQADGPSTRKLLLSRPDVNKHMAELEAMRRQYEEVFRQLQQQVRDFDHDPQSKQFSEKLKEAQNRLKSLQDQKHSEFSEKLKEAHERLKALEKEKSSEKNFDLYR